jgi:hypothetical protein
MFRRITRWNWLACFAVCNLVFWTCVAIGVGLLVTDTLDLGVESFIRAQHATAVVAWDQMSSARASAPATQSLPSATVVAERPLVRATVAPATGNWPLPTATPVVAPAGPTAASPLYVQPTLEPAAPAQSTQALASGRPIQSTSVPDVQNTAMVPPTAGPSTPTPKPAEALLSSPLLVSDPDMASMATIDAEMARSATGRPVQIRYDEDTLNRQVTAALANYPDLAYENVQLDLQRDQVVLKGNVTVMGFQVKAEAQGTLVAQDCTPHAEISKVSIAGVLTPGFIRDSIEKMILDSLSWYPPDYPLCVEQIVLEQDRVTIYGSRR